MEYERSWDTLDDVAPASTHGSLLTWCDLYVPTEKRLEVVAYSLESGDPSLIDIRVKQVGLAFSRP